MDIKFLLFIYLFLQKLINIFALKLSNEINNYNKNKNKKLKKKQMDKK